MTYNLAHLAHFEQELERFNALLCACNSATAMLTQWMRSPGEDSVTEIVAIERTGRTAAADAEQIGRLHVKRRDEIRYRRVWLVYKGRIVSDAENWYVPARLPLAMQDQLEQSVMPFGTIIAPSTPTRETLSNERLWHRKADEAFVRLPVHIIRHCALVRDADGLPISEVRETYTRNILRRRDSTLQG